MTKPGARHRLDNLLRVIGALAALTSVSALAQPTRDALQAQSAGAASGSTAGFANANTIVADSSSTTDVLVAAGSVWKYLDDGSDQGSAWRDLAFDDSAWAAGPTELGYGDADEATLVSYGPDANDKYMTTYFRRSFNVPDPLRYRGLLLRLLRDDGAVAYLNGAAVYTSNLPAGAIASATPASVAVEDAAYHSAAVDASLLVAGANILAVEIHQAAPNSSDISFDLELIGMTTASACGATDVAFGVIGDYGVDNTDELDVSELVKSWTPDFVITVGDNNYLNGSATTIDAHIGKYYHEFIGNYTGSYGPGAAGNNFYPALGNHDWDGASGSPALPAPYLDYFTLPGNERYYHFTRGPVEFFVVDSDAREPDGRTSNSTQATWLHTQLISSTAAWKLVYMHHPPYSSSSIHSSDVNLQWPYPAWGASAVLAGHDHTYERIVYGAFPYFVNGLGGQTRYDFGAPIPGSLVRYSADHGAMLVRANADCITFEFLSRAGVVIDTYTLNKNALPIFLPLLIKQ